MDSNNDNRKLDGMVASFVLGVGACTIVSVLLITCYTNQHLLENHDERYGIIRGIFASLFIVGVILLSVILKYIRKETRGDTKQRLTSSDKLKIFFLCVFGLGCIVKATLFFILTLETYGQENSKILWVLRWLWNIFEIWFIILQIRLFYVLKRHKVQFNMLFGYGIAFALIVNAAIWLLNILHGSLSFHRKDINSNTTNTNDVMDANNTTLPLDKWIDNYIQPFTGHMTVSFSLLSLSVFLSLWGSHASAQNVHVNVDVRDLEQEHVRDLEQEHVRDLEQEHVENQNKHETDALLPRENNEPVCCCTLSNWVLIIIGAFLGIPMVGLEAAFAFRTNSISSNKMNKMLMAFHSLQLVNNAILLIANGAVLVYLRFHSKKHSVNLRNNFLILLSFIGFQMLNVFNAVGHIMIKNICDNTTESVCKLPEEEEGNENNSIDNIDIAEHLVTFLGVMVQTMLLVKLNGYPSDNFESLKKMKKVIIFIFILNSWLWLGDCFFKKSVRSSSFPEAHVYGQSWYFMVDVLCPISVFYRFHSATESFHISSQIG